MMHFSAIPAKMFAELFFSDKRVPAVTAGYSRRCHIRGIRENRGRFYTKRKRMGFAGTQTLSGCQGICLP